jgi:hypothetical protein
MILRDGGGGAVLTAAGWVARVRKAGIAENEPNIQHRPFYTRPLFNPNLEDPIVRRKDPVRSQTFRGYLRNTFSLPDLAKFKESDKIKHAS